MKCRAIGVSLVTLIVASACGATDDANWTANEPPEAEEVSLAEGSVDGNVETLHRFEIEDTTFTYLYDGSGVMLHISASKTAPRIRVETATGVEPTLLEIFRALQPEAEPHEALVTSHLEAAEFQGREDGAVLPSALVHLVDKTPADLTSCVSYFLGVWGGGFGGGTPLVSSREGTSAGTTLQASASSVAQKFMAAGACNFAAVVPRLVAFDKRVGTGSWTTQLTADIAVDDATYIVHSPSAQAVNLRTRMIEAANNGMQLVAARRQ